MSGLVAPDVWDSAAFSSIFLASSFSCSQAESTPAPAPVTQTVVAVDKVTLHYVLDIPEPADSGSSSWLPWLKLGQRLGQEPLQQQNVLLSAWPVWPWLGAVVGLQRLRRKWTRLAQASLLLLFAAMLSGCVGFGFAMWGTIEGTYTFDKLEYVDPQQAAASTPDGADDQTGLIWKLTNGQGVVNVGLTMESETTTLTGETVKETEPCQLTATGSAKGMILTDGIITPPDSGE